VIAVGSLLRATYSSFPLSCPNSFFPSCSQCSVGQFPGHIPIHQKRQQLHSSRSATMAPGAVAPSAGGNILGGREFPPVTWYKDPGLRKLYFLLATVIMVSATNGFDGSMMNGLQTVKNWLNCKFNKVLTKPPNDSENIIPKNLSD
jgi:hypothetical protein